MVALLLGSWADEVGQRKNCLIGFSILGALATIGLGVVHTWQWSLLLFALANIGFSAGNVFCNSLLPVIAKENEWDSLSLKAYAWGYISGGVVLALNLAFIMKPDWFFLGSKSEGIHLSFISVGIWWLCFILPSFWFIHEKTIQVKNAGNLVKRRLQSLWSLVSLLPKQIPLLIFIVAYAFFNDGIQTVISMASIFGKEVLQIGEPTIISTYLITQFVGWPLSLGMIYLASKFGNKRILSFSLLFWIGIVTYAYFMKSALDFLILGGLVACVLGASQSLARSLYARLIPSGRNAEYYSIYALSGKFSALMGPLFFALIRDITGNTRLAILSMGLFFLIGVTLLQFVSIDPLKSKAVD